MSKASSIIKALIEGKEPKEIEASGLGSLKTIYKWRKVSEDLKLLTDTFVNLYCKLLDIELSKRE